MRQDINETNRMELTFWNQPENERIGRTTAAVFAAVLDPTLEEISAILYLGSPKSCLAFSMRYSVRY